MAAAPPPPCRAALLVAPTKAALGPLLASEIVSARRAAALANRDFSIALSGGSLPALLRDLPAAFANAGVDPQWERWHVLLADERCVPSSSEDSNLGAIRRNFAEAVPIPTGQVYGIDEALLGGPTEAVASDYETRVLRSILQRCGGLLDCAVLGFGPDGHTCSLFPGHPLLNERTRLVAPIDDSPKPPLSRITLTFPVLNSLCRKVIVCGAGESKRPILKAVFGGLVANPLNSNEERERTYSVEMVDPAPYPCGMVRPGGSEALVWVVDADAARQLSAEKYVGPDVAPDERFEDAVEAVQLAETDGEPVVVTGHPFLFVGSVGAAMNRSALERAGITHIINWSKTSRCNVHPGIEYMCITNVSNYKDMNNHLDVLDQAVEFIEKARREGGKALSQCWYGRNRSVTTLVAYLMKYSDKTGDDALKLIQKTRPIADSYRDTVRYYNRQYVKPTKEKRDAMAKTEGSN